MLQGIVRRHVERTLSLILAAGLLFVAFPGAGVAQEGTTSGSVAGTVVGPAGQPMADAVVRVVSQQRGDQREVLTDSDGGFRVPLLSPGLYTVRAELPPNQPVEVSDVRVTVGERTNITLELQPVEGQALEVAVGGATQIDVSESGVVDNVSQEQISSLPSAGRDFTDFINLSSLVSPQPGITTGGQFSIGGARTSGTNVQIDGADANNSFFSENRGSSRVPFTFSLESIKEFELVTNGYDVEYGRFSGGVVNAVTKSGGNQFEGSAHFFWRDEALTTNNFNDEEPIGFEAFQYGGTFSGPIVEDELHFFLSGDFQQWNQPASALTPERTNIPAATIDRIKDGLVDIYGFDRSFVEDQFGTFTETQDQANLFGRLDWTASPNHRFSFRANYQDFTNENDRLSEDGTEMRTAGSTFLDESISLVGEWNAVLGDDLFNTFRVQYSNEDRPRPGNGNFPHMSIDNVPTRDGGVTSIGLGGENFGITFANRLEEEKIQITENLTLSAGDHTIKIGTDNILSDITNEFWLNGNGIFFMSGGLDQFEDQNGGFFLRFLSDTENPEPPIAQFGVNNWSAYVQDQWQATDRLLLTAGLRWDYTDFVDPGGELANPDFQSAVESFGLSSTTVPSDTDNFGPRASFTYDLAGDESSVLRGGFGIFYGPMPGVTHGNVLQTTPNPTITIGCFGPSLEGFRDWTGEPPGDGGIPTTCSDFANDPGGFVDDEIEVAVWDGDAEETTTYKANLGYEHRLSDNWQAGVQAIFSRSHNLFGAVNRNLDTDIGDGTGFRRPSGRPVFVNPGDFDPNDTDLNEATINDQFFALYEQTSNGDARIWNFKVDVQGNPTENLQVAANYALNLAYDNSSTECCTANALLFDTPTAGDPNDLGDVGDDATGSWGPSKNERRHVLVANAIWRLPADLSASVIYRAQAGNPYTPSVSGDLNNDGDAGNDRPFLPDPDDPGASGYQFASEAALDQYRELLSEHDCLREAVGSIISRNTCRDPWWHSVDVKLRKGFELAGGHGFDVILDMFNVLDGLGVGAGEFVFESSNLFQVEGYEDDTDTLIVRTGNFGQEIPVGFEPFQFQAQLGVQYHF